MSDKKQPKSQKSLDQQMIPLTRLKSHPLNPNETNESQYIKLRENIRKTGRYPALIVRTFGDGYQIVDGHTRFLILQELGIPEAKCEVWDIDDKTANLYLATLNRLRGTDDTKKRAVLVKIIQGDFGVEDFRKFLPESNRAIDGLLKLADQIGPVDIESERGVLESKLINSGVDSELAEGISNLYQPPGTRATLKFKIKKEEDYQKAIKYFGKKPDVKKLMELI